MKIDYIVTGSIASIIYGNPRLTHDIDIVLSIEKKKTENFLECFNKELFYVPPINIFKIELNREVHGHVNIIHLESGFKADIYFLDSSKLQQWAIENYFEINFLDLIIRLAPIEYVIIQKMLFYKESNLQKHILDIQGILEHSRDKINFEVLNYYINNYNLQEIWQKIIPS